jgi:hypothetical protein
VPYAAVDLVLLLIFEFLYRVEMADAQEPRVVILPPKDVHRPSHDGFASPIQVRAVACQNEQRTIAHDQSCFDTLSTMGIMFATQ